MSEKQRNIVNAPVIEVEHVFKRYTRPSLLPARKNASTSGGKMALEDVSITVRQGETVGLLGPNGAGKTTLLKIIATLLYPTTGHVRLSGFDVAAQPLRARRQLGLVTCDERSFYWRLTGRHNLEFFATLYGLSPTKASERIASLLDTLDLTDAAGQPFSSYSSGMKQKLAIARGLLSDPQIVLYDEPTRSLDPMSTQNIRRWIVENRARFPGQTHLIATNQLDEAEALCDRVVIINRGRVIAQGTIREIHDRWHQQDFEIHRVTVGGFHPNGQLEADEEAGLFDVTVEREDDAGRHWQPAAGAEGCITLRLRTRKGSDALSRALHTILRSGGTVVRCETERVPFDDVFCSLVLGDRLDTRD
ncbi:MAG: ABC transporter ATP-binding protein [Phycisphaerae bacterium]